jgi:hypothetical protein
MFKNYKPIISALFDEAIHEPSVLHKALEITSEGPLQVCYVPFDHINLGAKLVIVGITPGHTQLVNAIREAKRCIDQGMSDEETLLRAKATAAFSGAIRPNLISLLDCIGLQHWLGLPTCAELFTTASHLVQNTSALRYPVFVNSANYNGAPEMTRHPILKNQLVENFGAEAKALRGAVFLPLGDKVCAALLHLADLGYIDRTRILMSLPHPSGANAERIAYFVGRKAESDLSSKTNPEKLGLAREALRAQVLAL